MLPRRHPVPLGLSGGSVGASTSFRVQTLVSRPRCVASSATTCSSPPPHHLEPDRSFSAPTVTLSPSACCPPPPRLFEFYCSSTTSTVILRARMLVHLPDRVFSSPRHLPIAPNVLHRVDSNTIARVLPCRVPSSAITCRYHRVFGAPLLDSPCLASTL